MGFMFYDYYNDSNFEFPDDRLLINSYKTYYLLILSYYIICLSKDILVSYSNSIYTLNRNKGV